MSDNDLIERLRRRAWDPARRHDTVYVPLNWLKSEYGDAITAYATSYRVRTDDSDPSEWPPDAPDHLKDAIVDAGAPAALAYFRDAPHEPPYAPASPAEVDTYERHINHKLPELLRRIYTEVSNGGFGPSYDILGIPPHGHRAYGSATWPTTYDTLGLPLVAAGCSVYWYVSLTEPGNPVHLWDADACDDPDDDPAQGIHLTIPTLRDWLNRWADGHDLYADLDLDQHPAPTDPANPLIAPGPR
ncbi:hypothetical protein SAMN05421505_104191 [Sinosporangium album]|uniref:SMI1 / KNR4 family (SUKH-1) n=1 Tax=Sinosporangium album TaxID=504805 RepID=A0A1G7UCF7_9ACTN|nr:hypothetical protein [Sinosporangium album]SDG44971.1 hypothetical protein SAMN05421505_104191 [Sinosporangium album]